MIIPLTSTAFEALVDGSVPPGLRLVDDSSISSRDVLAMLADLNSGIAAAFQPSAWLIVQEKEIVGLCSIVRPPSDGEVHIGYGVAPSRAGRGFATAAVAELLDWARGDHRVRRITAETALENHASHRVLQRNGFLRTGQRVDPEDGLLQCWSISM